MKGLAKYHSGRSPNNAKAIASGELAVLVDFLRELADIAWQQRDPETRNALLLDRAMAARYYAMALAAHLAEKDTGRPREAMTISDAVRAVEAAHAYQVERDKGTTAALAEKKILARYNIPRRLLRAAQKGNLPDPDVF